MQLCLTRYGGPVGARGDGAQIFAVTVDHDLPAMRRLAKKRCRPASRRCKTARGFGYSPNDLVAIIINEELVLIQVPMLLTSRKRRAAPWDRRPGGRRELHAPDDPRAPDIVIGVIDCDPYRNSVGSLVVVVGKMWRRMHFIISCFGDAQWRGEKPDSPPREGGEGDRAYAVCARSRRRTRIDAPRPPTPTSMNAQAVGSGTLEVGNKAPTLPVLPFWPGPAQMSLAK